MKFGYDFPGVFKSGEKATSGFVSKCAQISSKLVLLGNIVTLTDANNTSTPRTTSFVL